MRQGSRSAVKISRCPTARYAGQRRDMAVHRVESTSHAVLVGVVGVAADVLTTPADQEAEQH
jgi:hypothetical protein